MFRDNDKNAKKDSSTLNDNQQQTSKERQRHSNRNSRQRARRASPDFGEYSASSGSDDDSDKPGAVSVPGPATHQSTGIESFLSYFQQTAGWSYPPEDSGEKVLMAETVEDQHEDIDEAEREKIQQRAKRDVQLKIFSTAVEAEATDVVAEERKRKRKRLITLMIAALVLLVVGGGTGLIIALLTKPQSQQPEPPTASPTLSPTVKPPIFNAGGEDKDLGNTVCESAFDIATTVGETFFGNISNLARVAPVDTCEVIFRNGVGVWYRIQGDGSRYSASTCNGTSFDTQISIYSGACGKLQCVAGNDQMDFCGNGDQSLVAFATKPGQEYFLYVHARRQAASLFQMLVNKLESNDSCESATPLEFVNSWRVPLRFGSTRGASVHDVSCSGAIPDAPGVWYTVTGLGFDFGFGEFMSLRFQNTGSNFRARAFVFEGDDCGSLRCVSSSGLEWESEEGVIFYILVFGIQGSSEGDFQFYIERTEFRGTELPSLPPAGIVDVSFCETALPLFPGDMLFGNTRNQIPGPIGSCGDLVFNIGGGVWYDVVGTGGPLTVSTCDSMSDFDTQISVFDGPCGALECIGGNDQACGDQSSVSWFSVADVVYHVFVHGFGNHVGGFTLTLDEIEIPTSADCRSALDISFTRGVSILGDSSMSSSQSPILRCGTEAENGHGAWYKVTGEGRSMTASTCLSDETVTTHITIFEGDCNDLRCVEVIDDQCGSQNHAVTWTADDSKIYYIFVQAVNAASIGGKFVLYVEETTSNNLCINAIGPLGVDGSPTFGSIRSAASPQILPGLEDRSARYRGVWYSVLGTGTLVKASTCSRFTNFDTITLEVFEGSECADFDVLETNEEGCPGEDGVSKIWGTIEGETYYLLVGSSSSVFTGNFALSLEAV